VKVSNVLEDDVPWLQANKFNERNSSLLLFLPEMSLADDAVATTDSTPTVVIPRVNGNTNCEVLVVPERKQNFDAS
jgi:hypothetical protein